MLGLCLSFLDNILGFVVPTSVMRLMTETHLFFYVFKMGFLNCLNSYKLLNVVFSLFFVFFLLFFFQKHWKAFKMAWCTWLSSHDYIQRMKGENFCVFLTVCFSFWKGSFPNGNNLLLWGANLFASMGSKFIPLEKTPFKSTHNRFLWRKKKHYPRIIIKFSSLKTKLKGDQKWYLSLTGWPHIFSN